MDKTVTRFMPIFVPAACEEPRGVLPDALRMRGREEWVVVGYRRGRTLIQPVERFIRHSEEGTPKQFQAISNLIRLQARQNIDAQILKENFRTLFDELGQEFADAVTKQALRNPKKITERWLLPTFNEQIRRARLVMYCGSRGVLRPAIFCPNKNVALFVQALFSKMTACLGCGVAFTPRRPNQLYHDGPCGNRHRKRRQRYRKAPNTKK